MKDMLKNITLYLSIVDIIEYSAIIHSILLSQLLSQLLTVCLMYGIIRIKNLPLCLSSSHAGIKFVFVVRLCSKSLVKYKTNILSTPVACGDEYNVQSPACEVDACCPYSCSVTWLHKCFVPF